MIQSFVRRNPCRAMTRLRNGRCGNNIKTNVNEIRCENLAEDHVQWQAPQLVMLKLWVVCYRFGRNI